jgi:hypothetical protein
MKIKAADLEVGTQPLSPLCLHPGPLAGPGKHAFRQMKKYFVIGALLVSAAFARAKVGDTITQINQQYGNPYWEVDGGKAYIRNGLISVAVFDPAGICQSMMFERVNQSLSDDEIKRLDNDNLPDDAGQWINCPIPAKDGVQVEVWESSNLPFVVVSMCWNEPRTGLTLNGRMYADARSADLFQKVIMLFKKSSGFKLP